MLYPDERVIHDGMTDAEEDELLFRWHHPQDAAPRSHGHDPSQVVRSMFRSGVDMPIIPQEEWGKLLADQEAAKARLSDIRLAGNGGQPVPSLDQDGVGYCWAHSTVQAVTLARMIANLPYVPLSAFAVAATLKQGRDEGGWCGLSAQFATEKGIPSQALWPQGDRDYRKHDVSAVWDDAKKHCIVEQWTDLSADMYDRKLSWVQIGTCCLSCNPGPVDFNWWSHSVCRLDLVNGASERPTFRLATGKRPQLHEFDGIWAMDHPVTGGFGLRIWNSWSDSWSDRGMGVLTGDKAQPDSALAIRTVTAA